MIGYGVTTLINDDAVSMTLYVILAFGALMLPAYYFIFSRHAHRTGKMLVALAIHLCLIIAIIIYANAVRIWGYRDYQFVWILLYPLNVAMVIVYLVVARKSRRSAQEGSFLNLSKKKRIQKEDSKGGKIEGE